MLESLPPLLLVRVCDCFGRLSSTLLSLLGCELFDEQRGRPGGAGRRMERRVRIPKKFALRARLSPLLLVSPLRSCLR